LLVWNLNFSYLKFHSNFQGAFHVNSTPKICQY
jgi:hypothetical protein